MSGTRGAVSQHPPRMRLRINATDEAELYCYGCHEWLVVSIEFWPGRTNLWRCRACESERSRLYHARRAFDPEWREKQIAKSVRYRAYLRGLDPELVEAEARERRETGARRRRIAAAQSNAAVGSRAYRAAWQRVYRAERNAA